ncbi:MAG: DUF3108 domain-containing protein [Gemmatimonadetes bacterium]|nr:DUF3108 domain-containing protein [Gemmatimonadota bacterium]
MQPERRRSERSVGAVMGAVLGVLAVGPLQEVAAQQNGGLVRDSLTAVGPWGGNIPFHPGEELKYALRARGVGSGEAVMRVGQIDTVHGQEALPLEFLIEGRGWGGLFKLNDKIYSWMDPARGISLRFVKEQQHGKRPREYEFFPEEGRVQRIDHDTTWALPSALPLDDLSFVYFARTLPLEVGDNHTFNRYFKDAGNPISITVLRKDSIETRAGAFNTIVVRPILPESSLFPRGANAEIHFSDDDQRLVVYVRVTRYFVPLTLELTEFTPGVPTEGGDECGARPAREAASAAGPVFGKHSTPRWRPPVSRR